MLASPQAGLLAFGLTTAPPSRFGMKQWHLGAIPDSQWRDRAGFAPASLFTPSPRMRQGAPADNNIPLCQAGFSTPIILHLPETDKPSNGSG